jgi:hypothetical protein
LAGDTVGFPLVLVVSGAHSKLGLKADNPAFRGKALGFDQLRYTLVAQGSLQLKNWIGSILK